jgi:hypothetical protein
MSINSNRLARGGFASALLLILAVVGADANAQSMPVSGRFVYFLTRIVVHSQTPTGTGRIDRSTGVVKVEGGLNGYLLG